MEPASPAEPRSPLAAARSSWVATALRRDVVSRSARVALVVGTLLVAINYGDRLLAGELRRSDFVKMALTYLVPFGVSTHASVAALRSRVADAPP
ncbi:MAG TPA: nitrate/nitrite transporter NrtS [Myxococcota bacterium]|nr:nitrate/nitrite transporter NrtS [Myxococcota bacterium]